MPTAANIPAMASRPDECRYLEVPPAPVARLAPATSLVRRYGNQAERRRRFRSCAKPPGLGPAAGFQGRGHAAARTSLRRSDGQHTASAMSNNGREGNSSDRQPGADLRSSRTRAGRFDAWPVQRRPCSGRKPRKSTLVLRASPGRAELSLVKAGPGWQRPLRWLTWPTNLFAATITDGLSRAWTCRLISPRRLPCWRSAWPSSQR